MDNVRLNRLRRARIFQGYEDGAISAIIALGEEQHFQKGDVIFHKGDDGRYLYLVLEGTVSIYCGDKYLAKCRDYEAFGEMATFHQRPRSATARAVTEVNVLQFGEDAISQLLNGPYAVQFLLNIVEVLSARLEIGNAWIASSLESQRRNG